MEALKTYFKKHQDTLITVSIVILLDEWLFGGTMRDRIKAMIEKILCVSEKKITEGK